MTDRPNGNQAMPPMSPPPRQTLQQMLKPAEQVPAPSETAEAVGTIMAQAEAQIARVIRLGEYAREHGDYIADKCGQYARMARTNAENFASELLASEARRRDEIAKLIGKK